MMQKEVLLEVKNLVTEFQTDAGFVKAMFPLHCIEEKPLALLEKVVRENPLLLYPS
jgi:hypothetical protein